jgi:uncharacterized protein (DUF427 family)
MTREKQLGTYVAKVRGLNLNPEIESMKQAIWNNAIIAKAPDDRVKVVEGNVYFPPEVIDKKFIKSSEHTTTCGWKGTAKYYDLVVGGDENKAAAWYYPAPSTAAKEITGFVAFWKGVKVT